MCEVYACVRGVRERRVVLAGVISIWESFGIVIAMCRYKAPLWEGAKHLEIRNRRRMTWDSE